MKIKTLEKTIGFAILFLLMLKLMNVFSSTILFLLLGFIISVLYYILTVGIFQNNYLKEPFKNTHENKHKTILSILIGLGIASVTLGFTWYIMSLPGTKALLIIGTTILTLITLYLLFVKSKLNPEFTKSTLTRVILYMSVGLILVLIPKNTFLKIQYRNHPEYVKGIIELQNSPQDSLYFEKARKLYEEMND